ncbi:MAG TPA: 4-hydroxythreonine-4-phosphate dehydrogenase PdxA, partial [Steroidobacteraceae bacterium]|nr:4-hydroxythreonine-4-phosphate dehydrogenase PdxA [Steroidobacteraceae bacterium]
MKIIPRIALTSGEPAGIGPDLCLQIARDARDLPCELVHLADIDLLAARAQLLGITNVELRRYEPAAGTGAARPRTQADAHRQVEPRGHEPRRLLVLDSPLAAPCHPGRLEVRNARSVLTMLDRAIDGCLAGEFDAMVTAPVQKSCMLDAGIAFSGHTEYLAARTGAPRPVMMLAAGGFRVALATTHL